MLDVTQQTIRLYEQRGLITPVRSKGNIRFYSDEDVSELKFIQNLTKDMGVNLAGVEVVLKLKKQIEQLRTKNKQITEMLFEAAEMIQELDIDPRENMLPVPRHLEHGVDNTKNPWLRRICPDPPH